MTPPVVHGLFAAGGAGVAIGIAMLAASVRGYLAAPRAIDSGAGLAVFRVDGGYVSYRPFELSIEPTVIGVGIALLVGAVFVAAAVWRPRT